MVDGLNLEALFAAKRPPFSSPFVDGRIAVDVAKAYAAGKFAKVPVMVGATSADMGGPDGFMIKGARDVARTLSQSGVPVYAYRFSYVASSVGKPGRGTRATYRSSSTPRRSSMVTRRPPATMLSGT
ncbi:hypothetical protein ACFSLT_13110 [Novosphingobium resinovorum]